MSHSTFDSILLSAVYLFLLWFGGACFKHYGISALLGWIAVGTLLGPNAADIIPFTDDVQRTGSWFTCFDVESPRNGFNLSKIIDGDEIEQHSGDGNIWIQAGMLGIVFLICETGMHLNFERLRGVGSVFLVVAFVGTLFPVALGVVLYGGFLGAPFYPDALAAGIAFAPSSVGIAVILLNEARKLQSDAGQTIVAAALADDVLSLIGLVVLVSLASGSITAETIIVPLVSSVAFVCAGVMLGHIVFPKYLLPLLQEYFPEKEHASLQPRDQAQIIMFVVILACFSWIGEQIGSHLLGAFVAGLCFVEVPRSTLILNDQFKRIVAWFVRLFFGASVAFTIPICKLFDTTAFTHGLIAALVCIIGGKVASGVFVGRDRWVVGWAMVGRGEFAFVVADKSQELGLISPVVFASVIWALLWSIVLTPLVFRRVLRWRFKSEFGTGVRMFRVSIQGHHHVGAVHELTDVIHGFGLDIAEAHISTDGEVESETFTVYVPGHQPGDLLDKDKVHEVRQQIEEALLGRAEVIILDMSGGDMDLEKLRDSEADFGKGASWLEVDIIGEHSDGTLSDLVEMLESFDLEITQAESRTAQGKDVLHIYAKDAAQGKRTRPLERTEIRESVHRILTENGVTGQVMVKMLHGELGQYAPYALMATPDVQIREQERDLLELRVRCEHREGLLKSLWETIKDCRMECLGAEVTNEHHDGMFIHMFYIRDDATLTEGLKTIESAGKEALANIQRKVNSVNDVLRRHGRNAVKPKLGIMQKDSSNALFKVRSMDSMRGNMKRRTSSTRELDLGGGTPPPSPRKMVGRRSGVNDDGGGSNKRLERQMSAHVEGLLQSNVNSGMLYRGTVAEELDTLRRDIVAEGRSQAAVQKADTNMVNMTEEFDKDSFVELRRRSLIVSLEQVCSKFGVPANVTLRVVSRRFLKDEPDSKERAHALHHIAVGTPIQAFARRAHGHLSQGFKRILTHGRHTDSPVVGASDDDTGSGNDGGNHKYESILCSNRSGGGEVALPHPAEVDVVVQSNRSPDIGSKTGVDNAEVETVVVNVANGASTSESERSNSSPHSELGSSTDADVSVSGEKHASH